ncbi:MAG: mechanosensitive ion channel family protein [Candidatus Weimeria sp.]
MEGLSLSVSHPFSVGDKVRIISGGSELADGIVKSITLRHTILTKYDGEVVIIPNSVVNTSTIHNLDYTANAGRTLQFVVAYDSDINLAIKIVEKICTERTLPEKKKETSVQVSSLSDEGVVLNVTVWAKDVDSSFAVCSDIRRQVLSSFKKAGIRFANRDEALSEISEALKDTGKTQKIVAGKLNHSDKILPKKD